MHFDNFDRFSDYVSTKPRVLKDYLIGVDKDNHYVIKQKTWFNKTWLGRQIEKWRTGNDFLDKKKMGQCDDESSRSA